MALPAISHITSRSNLPPEAGTPARNHEVLLDLHLPTPEALLLTNHAFTYFLHHQNLLNRILVEFNHTELQDPQESARVITRIRKLIQSQPFPKDIHKAFFQLYDSYIASHPALLLISPTPSTLRLTASTQLPLSGSSLVADHIRQTWASAFTPTSLQQISLSPHLISLVNPLLIKSLPLPDFTGVVISRSQHRKHVAEVIVNAGITHYIVPHLEPLIPERHLVDMQTQQIISSQHTEQHHFQKLSRYGKLVLQHRQAPSPMLTPEEVITVANYATKIQNHMLTPQAVVFIKHGRKLEIISYQESHDHIELPTLPTKPLAKPTANLTLITSGLGCSPGLISAPATLVKDSKHLNQFPSGHIAVIQYPSLQLLPVLKKAVGLVSVAGGPTSHTAIISREIGLPAVLGAKDSFKLIKQNQVITIDGATGQVFRGALSPLTPIHLPEPTDTPPIIASKIFLQASSPISAQKQQHTLADGIGAIRGDVLLVEYGKHPKVLQEHKSASEYYQHLLSSLIAITATRPTSTNLFHCSDIPSHHRSQLKFGEYEPKEDNPSLGLRGARYSLVAPTLFDLEIRTFLDFKHQTIHAANTHLVLPWARTVREAQALKKHAASLGYTRSPRQQIWISLHTPSNLLSLKEILAIGFDGAVLNLNALTTFHYGVDLNNPEVSLAYPRYDESLLMLIKQAKTAIQEIQKPLLIYSQFQANDDILIQACVDAGVYGFITTASSSAMLRNSIAKAEDTTLKRTLHD